MNRVKKILEDIALKSEGIFREHSYGDEAARSEAEKVMKEGGVAVSLLKSKTDGKLRVGLVTSGPLTDIGPETAKSLAKDLTILADICLEILGGADYTDEEIMRLAHERREG